MSIGKVREMISKLLRKRTIMVWEIRRMGEELLVESGAILESEISDDWET